MNPSLSRDFDGQLAATGCTEAMESLGHDKPGSALALGMRVFWKEHDQMLSSLADQVDRLGFAGEWFRKAISIDKSGCRRLPPDFVSQLTLDIDKVVNREKLRGVPETSPLVGAVFTMLCWSLDRIYQDRPIPKFWVLETVARIPYFSYITVLHLYESLGWWRTPQLRQVHSAEEDNELHHLLIMESLGGNSEWMDRFIAEHAAVVYYWIVVILFMLEPGLAYNFSHLVEEHAYVTYTEFVEQNEAILREIAPPPVAVSYYRTGDLYFFDKFQTSHSESGKLRRPPCENMFDVFSNIRDDEYEHILTMRACQDWWGGTGPSALPSEELTALGSREDWQRWCEEVNTGCRLGEL